MHDFFQNFPPVAGQIDGEIVKNSHLWMETTQIMQDRKGISTAGV
jgi:hypothetical protein